MAESILTSVKKVVGITELDTSFDPDIIMHTNTVFSVLNQLGVGPVDGFMIEDVEPTWDDFLNVRQVGQLQSDGSVIYTDQQLSAVNKLLNMVKSYVYLRVRLMFDPPQTSFVIESQNKQIEQLEVRISILREGESWVDPSPTAITETVWC